MTKNCLPRRLLCLTISSVVLIAAATLAFADDGDEASARVAVSICDRLRATVDDTSAEAPVDPAAVTTDIISYDEAGRLFDELLNRYSADDATESDKRRVQRDLDDLIERVGNAIDRLKVEDSDPEARVQFGTLSTAMNAWSSEVLEELGDPAPEEPAAGMQRGPTIPRFQDGSRAAEAADVLREARRAYREHLAREPEDLRRNVREIREMSDWTAQRSRLEQRMIIAEEGLAWAATDYTHGDILGLIDPFNDLAEVRNGLAEKAKEDEGLSEIVATLDRLRGHHNFMMQSVTTSSWDPRQGMLIIPIISLINDEWVARGNAANAALGEIEHTFLIWLSRVNDGVSDMIRSRRERGVRAIRDRACFEAARQGLAEPVPFFLHRPGPGNSRLLKDITREMRRIVAARLGQSDSDTREIPLGFLGDRDDILDADESLTRAIDSAERRRLAALGE